MEMMRLETGPKQRVIVAVVASVFPPLAIGLLFGSSLVGLIFLVVIAGVNLAVVTRWSRKTTLSNAVLCLNFLLGVTGPGLTAYYIRDWATRVPFRPRPNSAGTAWGQDLTVGLPECDTEYRAIVPDVPRASRWLPVVVLLHGNNGDWAEIIGDTQWDRVARENGWLLLAPNAPGITWGDDADRVVLETLTDAAGHWPIDTNRVLLTGRSDGASCAYTVGLRYPHVFRAIAPVAGSYWPLAPLHAFRSRHLGVYIYHGARDPIFRVDEARRAAWLMRLSDHEVLYREDSDGGHEYTPAESQRIGAWFAGVCQASRWRHAVQQGAAMRSSGQYGLPADPPSADAVDCDKLREQRSIHGRPT
jgi:dienelactone hydrolase